MPDVRKQAQLDAAEQRCALLQHEIDNITAGQVFTTTITTRSTCLIDVLLVLLVVLH